MNTKSLIVLVIVGVIVLASSTGVAEEMPGTIGSSVQFQLQLGFMGRISGGEGTTGGDDHILTGDLSILFPVSERTSYGFGFKAAGSERYDRYGLRGIWRKRFSPDSNFYFQLAPGVYLAGDTTSLSYPAGFLEGEVGITNYLALVAMVEIKGYHGTEYDYNTYELREVAGTDVSWFIGGKGGQWPALLAAVVVALVSQIEINMDMSMGM